MRSDGRGRLLRRRGRRSLGRKGLAGALVVCLVFGASACQQIKESVTGVVRPRALRDVPAARLAFRLEPDVDTSNLPASFKSEETGEDEQPLAPVKADFETRRKDEALLRTVLSPNGQVALALYATGETAEGDFRMDLYSKDGQFLRNVLPPELIGTFPQWVAWSPDGQQIAFIGIKNPTPQPTPDEPLAPVTDVPPVEGAATPTATVAPLIAPVPVYSTEQIYICDRDGFQLRPLTSRDGLIYFQFNWSPDARAVAALACKPDEWDARRSEDRMAAGRPRLIDLEGHERLLSDRLSDAAPAWSPDASKVAAAFDTDIAIYDASANAPTGANLPLRDSLLAASAQYDQQKLSKKTTTSAPQTGAANTTNATNVVQNNSSGGANTPGAASSPNATASTAATTSSTPLSFNPIVRLEWLAPEALYVRTAFVRLYKGGELVTNYPRWHVVHLSPQAAVLTELRPPAGSRHAANPRAAEASHSDASQASPPGQSQPAPPDPSERVALFPPRLFFPSSQTL